MMRNRTIQRRTRAAAERVALPGVHPVLQGVYAARGVRCLADLTDGLGALAGTDGLAGLSGAVERLARAITSGQSILVVGDFDADGASSCALAVLAMRAMGARHVDYLVPNRFEFGYGLTPEIVGEAKRRQPDLLVTVDNGVSSVDGVAMARHLGMGVIVTDHHLPPEHLPDADALVNPNQPGDAFPSKHLAGVGVIFYVLAALRQHLRAQGWFAGRCEPRMADYLDLVALGTVADVVPLDRNNRILVEQGLRRIRADRARPGIRALLEIAGRDPGACVAADLGFAAGPRLNAAGRLKDMAMGIECLLTDHAAEARRYAQRLDALNRERREIEGRMEAEAVDGVAVLRRSLEAKDGLPSAICVTDSGWHQGVVGIVAARLKERFHRPVVAFAPAGEGVLKGSGRSIDALHLRDALERVATAHPGLIRRFGGHAAAAGLSVDEQRFPAFREAFEAVVGEALADTDLAGVCLTDGALRSADMTLDLAQAIRAAGPWGQGFPEPRFDGVFSVLGSRVVGDRHLKLRLRPEDGGPSVDAIAFRAVDAGWVHLRGWVRIAYRLEVNLWQGRASLQLVVEHLEAVSATAG
ncbi:single-stranded-DNA-specific exonuclease RecJ [Aquisalimonas sp.]|uniref:single-stranded-DNA-specific exonuclease RecJ n=1 Tax=Aquisalimonas sp. TaxID=1872621 RepID=UPI0025C00E0C|nr:single-stranded-DNA-specific exonuclease RecJ [Aquisalimonas sp.]